MIAECPGLLFQLPEGAFDPKTVTVQTDDGQRFQFQAGTHKNTLDSIHFYQDKAQFLIQLLPHGRSKHR